MIRTSDRASPRSMASERRARLSPTGYQEIDRTHVIDPDNPMPGRLVVWSHPAFANRKMFVRNDHEIVCVSLAR